MRILLRRLGLLAVCCSVAAVVGCGKPSTAPTGSASGSDDSTGTPAAKIESPPLRETFETYSWQGSQIGTMRTAYYADVLDGRPVVRIVSTGTLTFLRFGQKIEQQLRDVTWETEAGDVLRFESFMLAGSAPQVVTGTVTAATATLTMRTAGKTTTETLAWPRGTGGSTRPIDELRRKPMYPGETRTVSAFAPILNRVAKVELTAEQREPVDVGGTTRELLRVKSKMLIAGTPAIESVSWCDTAGEVWKTDYPALGQTSVRTTAAEAGKTVATPSIDLGTDTMVRIAPPLVDAHQTKLVRYLVRLKDGDAAAHFPNGASQTVTKRADGAAEIVVTAVRPTTPLPAGYAPTPPTEQDRQPSSLIQSDDAAVKELAVAAGGNDADSWDVAVRCESLVKQKMRSVEFSTAFATAAETAKTLTGDCTEHAVLLCALLRARGIPARAAIGLVYVDRSAAMGYHLWTEAFIAGRWIPLDATVGRGGTSAAYLKLADSNLHGVDSYAAFLPVFPLLGKLQIEVSSRE